MDKLTRDIYIIGRLSQSFYTREFRKIQINMGQFPFIITIADTPGISQEQLSAATLIGKSTTATVVKQLQEIGIITRETDAVDHRMNHLYITDKGLSLIPKIRKIIDKCHAKITEGLTDVEKEIFRILLNKVMIQSVASLKKED